MPNPDTEFGLVYAGVDIMQVASGVALEFNNDVTEWRSIDGTLQYIQGNLSWKVRIENTSSPLPSEGEIKLSLPHGFAKGRAYWIITRLTPFGSNFSGELCPIGEASQIHYPEQEALDAVVQAAEVRGGRIDMAIQVLELQNRIKQFTDMSGDWVVWSEGYDESCDSCLDAIREAVDIIDQGAFDFDRITCDGIDIFDDDDIELAIERDLLKRKGE